MVFENIEINFQFAKALQLMEDTEHHIFVTGRAGTGKSTLLEQYGIVTAQRHRALADVEGVLSLLARENSLAETHLPRCSVNARSLGSEDFRVWL
ncbi:MAG: hypothetical protein R6U91_07030 [Bacillota bacterium]